MAQEFAVEKLFQKDNHGADFRVYTSDLVPAKTAAANTFHPLFAAALPAPPDTTIYMVGSSTEKDLHGDNMRLTALEDMQNIPERLTIFMNHDYTLPASLFGSILTRPILVRSEAVSDLYLAADAETTNADAMQTYGYILKGRRIGCSGGFKVEAWEVEGDEDDFFAPLAIIHVRAVEFSTVGIPANQRSWVENAAQGIFMRSIIEDRGEDAIRLAPIVKGLFPNDFRDITKMLESQGLRKSLEKAPMRPQHQSRLLWDPPRRTFVISEKGEKTEIERGALPAFIAQGIADMRQVREVSRDPRLATILNRTADDTPDSDLLEEGACGKTSWGLMDKATPWSGSKARKQIFAYADGSASKAKGCFMFYSGSGGGSKDGEPDLEEADGGDLTQGDFKLPFCYVSGSPKIVFNGAKAIANVLMGGRGGVKGLSDSDRSSVKSKVSTIYRRFDETPPWAKSDEKDFDPDTDLDWEGIEDVDITEIEDLLIEADGNHAPTNGSHKHAHPPFGAKADGHNHKHTHDNDNNHDHHGDGSKSEEELEEKAGAGVDVDSDGNHAAYDGSHTHHHRNYGSKADGSQHTHNHAHSKDSNHKHSHDGDGDDGDGQKSADDLILKGRVRAINMLLSEVGITESITIGTNGKAILPLSTYAAGLNDRLLGVGKQLHAVALSVHPDSCTGGMDSDGDSDGERTDGDAGKTKGNGSVGDNPGQSIDDARREAESERNTLQHFTKAMETLTTSVTALSLSPDLRNEQGIITAGIRTAQAELEEMRKKAQESIDQFNAQLAELRGRPLGRPTQLNTGVIPESLITNATYADMLSAGSGNGAGGKSGKLSLKEARALTRVVSKEMKRQDTGDPYYTLYREWPEGVVPEGGRPPLSGDHISLMSPGDVWGYAEGKRALVPLLDEPVEAL